MDGEDRALKFSISADELAEFAQELNDSINSDSLLKKENKKESPSNTKSKSDWQQAEEEKLSKTYEEKVQQAQKVVKTIVQSRPNVVGSYKRSPDSHTKGLSLAKQKKFEPLDLYTLQAEVKIAREKIIKRLSEKSTEKNSVTENITQLKKSDFQSSGNLMGSTSGSGTISPCILKGVPSQPTKVGIPPLYNVTALKKVAQPNPPGIYSQPTPPGTYSEPIPPGTYSKPNLPRKYSEPIPPGTYSEPIPPGTYSEPIPPGTYCQPILQGTYSQPNPPCTYSQHTPPGTYSQPNQPDFYSQPNQPDFYSQPNQPDFYSQHNQPVFYSQSNQLDSYSQPNQPDFYSQPNQHCSYSQPNQLGAYSQPNQLGAYSQPNQPGSYSQHNQPDSYSQPTAVFQYTPQHSSSSKVSPQLPSANAPAPATPTVTKAPANAPVLLTAQTAKLMAVKHPLLPSTQKAMYVPVTENNIAPPTSVKENSNKTIDKDESSELDEDLVKRAMSYASLCSTIGDEKAKNYLKGQISILIKEIPNSIKTMNFKKILQAVGRLPFYVVTQQPLSEDSYMVKGTYTNIEGASRAIHIFSKLSINGKKLYPTYEKDIKYDKSISKLELLRIKELKITISKLLEDTSASVKWDDDVTAKSRLSKINASNRDSDKNTSDYSSSKNSYPEDYDKGKGTDSIKSSSTKRRHSRSPNSSSRMRSISPRPSRNTRDKASESTCRDRKSSPKRTASPGAKRKRAPSSTNRIYRLSSVSSNNSDLDSPGSISPDLDVSSLKQNRIARDITKNVTDLQSVSLTSNRSPNKRKPTQSKSLRDAFRPLQTASNVKIVGGMMNLSKATIDGINAIFGGTRDPVLIGKGDDATSRHYDV